MTKRGYFIKPPPARTETNSGQAAFSLTEVIVAIGIVGLLCFFMLSGISFGYTMVRLERENRRATQVMLDKMEQMRLFNWEQITTNGLPTNFTAPFYLGTNNVEMGFTYTGTVAIANAPLTESYAPAMRQVTVSVTWFSGGMVHERQMSTLLSSNGLHQYVY